MSKRNMLRYGISTAKALVMAVLTYLSSTMAIGVEFRADRAFWIGLGACVVNALLKILADWNVKMISGR